MSAPPQPWPSLAARATWTSPAVAAGLIIAALGLSTLSFFLSALPLAVLLVVTWDRWQPLPRDLTFPILGFLALELAVTPLLPAPWVHVSSLLTTSGLWFAYWRIVAGLPFSARQTSWIWHGITATGCLLGLIALANSLGFADVWQWGELPWVKGQYVLDMQLSADFKRGSGFSMNPNILAGILVLTWPVALRQMADSAGRDRAAWLVTLLVQWFGLLLTQSRGAVGALVAVALTWLWRERSVRIPLLQAVLAAGLGLILTWPAWSPLLTRLETIPDATHHSNSIRIALFRSGLEMIADRPLTGVGAGGFDVEYYRYRYPEDTANCPHLHSWYLQTAVEAGLPAALLFFAALGAMTWYARRERSVAAECMLGGLIFGMTDYLLHDARVALVMWTILALGTRPVPSHARSCGPNARPRLSGGLENPS